MLPRRFQGLGLPNPNIDVLGAKIHFLHCNWGLKSASGQMLKQAYGNFQVKVGLVDVRTSSLAASPWTVGSKISGSCAASGSTRFLTFLFSARMTALGWA